MIEDTPPALPVVDVTKPMRMHFTHTNYVVDDAHVFGSFIYAVGKGCTCYHRFSLTGQGDHPRHKLVNEPEPKKQFTKKLAWIEHWGNVSPIAVTPDMEAYGLVEYLRNHLTGKCIAITDVTFTEGEGNPPTY